MVTREHTFRTEGPVSADLRVAAGPLTVHLEDTDTVTVRVSAPTQEDVDAVPVRFDGHTLVVESPAGDPQRHWLWGRTAETRISVDVCAPAHTNLRLRTGSASASVRGVAADVDATAGSGTIDVEECADLTTRAGSGDVRVTTVHGSARATAGSGTVRIGTVEGGLEALTGSGSIVADHVGGGLDATSGSGTLTIGALPHGPGHLKSGSGDITVRSLGASDVTARAASGDVDLSVAPDVPLWADLRSVSGTVRREVAAQRPPAQGEPYATVRARTISGDIVVRRD